MMIFIYKFITIYIVNKTMIAGGYTSANNQDDKLFSLIDGEMIIIEYYESQESYGEGIINIIMLFMIIKIF